MEEPASAMEERASAAQVLQELAIAPRVNEDNGDNGNTYRTKVGRPKGSTATAILNLKEKKKRAIDEVATRYSSEKENNGGKTPIGSFPKICSDVLNQSKIHS